MHTLASESGRLASLLPSTVVGVLDRHGDVAELSPARCLRPGELVVLRGRERETWRVLDSSQPGP